MSKPRCVKTVVSLASADIAVYAGVKVSKALDEVTKSMDVYQGVRLTELLEAVYMQGKKDGARSVSESFREMMKDIPHLNPGQPKKAKPAKSSKKAA